MAWTQFLYNQPIHYIINGDPNSAMRLSAWYDAQRSGTSMQYKIRTTVSIGGAYYYQDRLTQVIALDGNTTYNQDIKSHTSPVYGWSITTETGWMNVANKTSGNTTLYLGIYDPQISYWVNYSVTTYLPVIMIPPSSPTWTNINPNPVEVNTNFLITWGGASAGSNGVLNYDIDIRAYSNSGGYWTDWLRLASGRGGTSWNSAAPKNLTVYGVSAAIGNKFQFRIRSTDSSSLTSGWVYTNEVILGFISPTSPTSISFSSPNIKKDESVVVTWSGASGGSGSITQYGISFRRYIKTSSEWTDWTNDNLLTAQTYNWTPITTFPDLVNGDTLQARARTYNSWTQISSYLNSGNLIVKGNQLWINVGGTWYEGTCYININGTWYEGTPFVNVNGTWYESL